MYNADLTQLVQDYKCQSDRNWGTSMLVCHPESRKILLGKRIDTQDYANPGGMVEFMESPIQAALRETREESNIAINSCGVYGCQPHKSNNGQEWVSFLFFTDDFDDSYMTPQGQEIEDWGWYDIEDAMNMNLFPPAKMALEKAIEARLFSQYPLQCEYIPYIECPATASEAQNTRCCAFSYQEPEQVFTTHQLLPWD